MKRILHSALFAALAFGASTVSLLAQSPNPGPHGPPDGPPPPHHGPPPSPLFEALDTNHDGVLSADEIANAPAVLAKLADKDGQITRDSLRPPPPDKNGGPMDDHRGPSSQSRPADPDQPGANPPPDHRHGPPPDGARPQNRHQPAADSSSSPAAGASPGPEDQGPPRHHGPPPGGPLFDALDTNHDGIISADEIANAAASLKTLDKNGDGQITREELRPPGPPPGGPRD